MIARKQITIRGHHFDVDVEVIPTTGEVNLKFNGLTEKQMGELSTKTRHFDLNQNEWAKATKFIDSHNKKCHEGFSYIITPTGIGDNVHIRCNGCRKEKDVTDYGSW